MGSSRLRSKLLTVALCLSTIALVLLASCQKPYGYEPAGDELFDRFAVLALKQIQSDSWRELVPRKPGLREGFNYDELAQWEDDFGTDPRYWQLRWLCAQSMPLPSNVEDRKRLNELVIQAIDDGIVDEGSYTAIDYHRANISDPAKALALVEHALELSPDNAYYHYVQAYLLERQGDREGALAALRRGNQAPRNDLPRIYPLDLLTDHPEYFEVEANEAVRGRLLGLAHVLQVGSSSPWTRRLVKDLMASYVEPLPLDVADELLALARRYGERGDNTVIEQLLALIELNRVIERLQDDYPDTDIQERLDLLDDWSDILERMLKDYVYKQPRPEEVPTGYEGYVQWWDSLVEERAFIAAECQPVLDEIAAIKLAED